MFKEVIVYLCLLTHMFYRTCKINSVPYYNDV